MANSAETMMRHIEQDNMLIDDLKDLCDAWHKNRSEGRTPKAIKRAIVLIAEDLARLPKDQ
jgi:hypothetical protein